MQRHGSYRSSDLLTLRLAPARSCCAGIAPLGRSAARFVAATQASVLPPERVMEPHLGPAPKRGREAPHHCGCGTRCGDLRCGFFGPPPRWERQRRCEPHLLGHRPAVPRRRAAEHGRARLAVAGLPAGRREGRRRDRADRLRRRRACSTRIRAIRRCRRRARSCARCSSSTGARSGAEKHHQRSRQVHLPRVRSRELRARRPRRRRSPRSPSAAATSPRCSSYFRNSTASSTTRRRKKRSRSSGCGSSRWSSSSRAPATSASGPSISVSTARRACSRSTSGSSSTARRASSCSCVHSAACCSAWRRRQAWKNVRHERKHRPLARRPDNPSAVYPVLVDMRDSASRSSSAQHELIASGRRGDLPRLGRRRLDLPLARADGARLSRLGAAREPRPARSETPTRTRASARSVSAPRSSTAAAGATEDDCASSATRSRPTGCARPGTPLPTRSRRSSTGSSRAAPRRGSSRGARTASSARCSDRLARGDRGVLPRGGLEFRDRLVEPRHEARPDPRGDPAAAARAASRRPTRNLLAARARAEPSRARRAARLDRRLEAARPRRRPAPPCASTTASGSSTTPVALERRGALGRVADRLGAPRP